jgi:hypothetical protein
MGVSIDIINAKIKKIVLINDIAGNNFAPYNLFDL